MSSVVPLVLAGLGLLAGLAAAWRLLLTEPPVPRLPDLDLRIADLREQRDQLYERLRGAEGIEPSAADREALERSAARALRELERLEEERARERAEERPRGRAPAPRREAAAGAPGAPQSAERALPEPAGLSGRHPLLAGFLLGGGLVGLLALLVFWAQRDARPAPEDAAAAAPETAPGASPQLPPGVAEQVAQLRAQLAGGPEDLELHRQLAEILLVHGQFVDAFREADAALAIDPDDAEGLYVQGVVRFMMGQPELALDLLDRSLERAPGNTRAALMKGVFLLRLDDRTGAVAAWQEGLEAAGGSEPRLEHLLRLEREGRSADEILSLPPPG